MATAIIIVIVALFVNGCAAAVVWTKDGLTQAEFERDRADCKGRVLQSPHTTDIAGMIVMGPAIMESCMQSKGYVKQ